MNRRSFLHLGGVSLAGLNSRPVRWSRAASNFADHDDWPRYVATSDDFTALRTVAPVDWLAAEILDGTCELFFASPDAYPERDVRLRVPVPSASSALQVIGEVGSTSALQHRPSDGRTCLIVNFFEEAAVTIFLPKKSHLELVALARHSE